MANILSKVPRRYRPFIFPEDYEDIFVICVKYPPVSLLKMRKMEYFWEYLYGLLDDPAYPEELRQAEDFFIKISESVFEEYGLSYYCYMGSDESFMPIQQVDFKIRKHSDKCYSLVIVVDRHFSLSPFCHSVDTIEPVCIWSNRKKLHTYNELEHDIKVWLEEICKDEANS